ncbi:MAG: hypothetical protein QNJ04_00050 [Desulfobacterales bacterium]|nr:hypothetical protein [Desulfobacterales bacterium]
MDAAVNDHPQLLPCAKYSRYQDSREPRCSDPELYCKHRSSCLIHCMEKIRKRRDRQPDRPQ